MFAAGAHLTGVLSHFVILLDPSTLTWAYILVSSKAGYFVLMALALGTLFEARKRPADVAHQQVPPVVPLSKH
jgi:bacteriorhodopsin